MLNYQRVTVLLFNKFDTKLKAFPCRCGGGSSGKRDAGEGLADVSAWDVMRDWLVVWNMAFIFPYSGNNHPNWLILFRGVETTNPETIMRFRGPRVEFFDAQTRWFETHPHVILWSGSQMGYLKTNKQLSCLVFTYPDGQWFWTLSLGMFHHIFFSIFSKIFFNHYHILSSSQNFVFLGVPYQDGLR